MTLQMAAAQLGKVETLIGIGQYDSARMQLRQGAASTIRLDLRAYDRSRHIGPDDPQVTLMAADCISTHVVLGFWQGIAYIDAYGMLCCMDDTVMQ